MGHHILPDTQEQQSECVRQDYAVCGRHIEIHVKLPQPLQEGLLCTGGRARFELPMTEHGCPSQAQRVNPQLCERQHPARAASCKWTSADSQSNSAVYIVYMCIYMNIYVL